MKKESKELELLKQLFVNLSEQDKKAFLESLDTEKAKSVIQPREIKCCPHCQGTHFVKNGQKSGHQRYICRECRKSFVAQSGTILYGSTKDIRVWEKYIHCMMERKSLRASAAICGIHLSTAFIWRHKILDALQQVKANVELSGIVEADETFTRVSYKGHHKNFKLPRQAYKRGTPAGLRGLSKEQVCIPVGVNLSGQSVAKVSNLGKPTLEDIEKVLGQRIEKSSILVTDSFSAYKRFSERFELNHIQIPRHRYTSGVFNIQKVNAYHREFKAMLFAFKGVATKYLNNYLTYLNFVNIEKDLPENKEAMLINLIQDTSFYISSKSVSDRPAIPI